MEPCALNGAAESREPQDFHLSSKNSFNILDEPEAASGYMAKGVFFKLELIPVMRWAHLLPEQPVLAVFKSNS